MPGSEAHAEAAGIIRQWLRQGRFPDRLLQDVVDDRNQVAQLVYGVAKTRGLLEHLLNERARRGIDRSALPFLLIGAYELLFSPHTPSYAAVNETVASVSGSGSKFASGFVNAMLRRLVREREAILGGMEKLPVHLRSYHPEALYLRWEKRLGRARAEALCRWNNGAPDLMLVVNRRLATLESMTVALAKAGIGATAHGAFPGRCLRLDQSRIVEELPGYKEGHFSVQDPSTLVAVDLLDIKPGMTVLDACAGPGGKTGLIVQASGEPGRVWALDKQEDRLSRVTENMTRLGAAAVTARCADASNPDVIRSATGRRDFDRILLDVPCSNTGVLRRRADARWRFDEKGMERYTRLQRRLLESGLQLLAKGGALVYSTCSIEPEEGEELVRAVLSDRKNMEIDAVEVNIPPDRDMDGCTAIRIRRR